MNYPARILVVLVAFLSPPASAQDKSSCMGSNPLAWPGRWAICEGIKNLSKGGDTAPVPAPAPTGPPQPPPPDYVGAPPSGAWIDRALGLAVPPIGVYVPRPGDRVIFGPTVRAPTYLPDPPPSGGQDQPYVPAPPLGSPAAAPPVAVPMPDRPPAPATAATVPDRDPALR